MSKGIFYSELKVFDPALVAVVGCQLFFDIFWVGTTSFWHSVDVVREPNFFFGVIFHNLGVSNNLKNGVREIYCCISPSAFDCQYKAGVFFADVH